MSPSKFKIIKNQCWINFPLKTTEEDQENPWAVLEWSSWPLDLKRNGEPHSLIPDFCLPIQCTGFTCSENEFSWWAWQILMHWASSKNSISHIVIRFELMTEKQLFSTTRLHLYWDQSWRICFPSVGIPDAVTNTKPDVPKHHALIGKIGEPLDFSDAHGSIFHGITCFKQTAREKEFPEISINESIRPFLHHNHAKKVYPEIRINDRNTMSCINLHTIRKLTEVLSPQNFSEFFFQRSAVRKRMDRSHWHSVMVLGYLGMAI